MTTYLDILPIELQEKIYDMKHEMEEEQRAQDIREVYMSLMNIRFQELKYKCDDIGIPRNSYHWVKCNYVNALISFELLKDESLEFMKEMCDEFKTPVGWVKDCTSKMDFIMLLAEDYVDEKLEINVYGYPGYNDYSGDEYDTDCDDDVESEEGCVNEECECPSGYSTLYENGYGMGLCSYCLETGFQVCSACARVTKHYDSRCTECRHESDW